MASRFRRNSNANPSFGVGGQRIAEAIVSWPAGHFAYNR